jgi:Ca2+-binding RTX toxin-like protein
VQDINRQPNAFDGDFTFLNTLLTGASDAVTLGLSNVGQIEQGGPLAPDIRILSTAANTGVDILNVSVTGGARLGELFSGDSAAATTLTTLNVSGSGTSLRVDGAIDFLNAGTINASGLSNGGIQVQVNANDNVAVTGGAGDDTVDFNTFNDAQDSFNGGSAGTDTVVVDTALASAPTKWTSVEVFAVNNDAAALTQDMDNVGNGITRFGIFGTGQNVTFEDMPNNSTVTITGANPTNVDLEVKTDSLADSLDLVFNRPAGLVINDLDVGVDGIAANLVETLRIDARSANTGVEYQITDPAGIRAQNITISGATAVDLGDVLGGTDNAMGGFANQVINAEALTGRLGVLGGNGVQQITGGSGNDILMGGAGADILAGGPGDDRLEGDGVAADDVAADRLSGGAGRDIFVFDDAGDHDATLAGADVILDLVSGTDIIELDDTAFALGVGPLGVGEYVEMTLATFNAASVETQAAALGIAAATDYIAVIRTSDNNRTYVAYDDNHAAAGIEVLAELSGVDLTGIAPTDFTVVA